MGMTKPFQVSTPDTGSHRRFTAKMVTAIRATQKSGREMSSRDREMDR